MVCQRAIDSQRLLIEHSELERKGKDIFSPRCSEASRCVSSCDFESFKFKNSLQEQFKKFNGKLDCLIYEMLFIKKKKPSLNTQSDSIRAKIIYLDILTTHTHLRLIWQYYIAA